MSKIPSHTVMTLIQACEILSRTHTRDDELTGYVVETLPRVFEMGRQEYIEAWGVLREAIIWSRQTPQPVNPLVSQLANNGGAFYQNKERAILAVGHLGVCAFPGCACPPDKTCISESEKRKRAEKYAAVEGGRVNYEAFKTTEPSRDCTCHPDDGPLPWPFPKQHAFSQCVEVAARRRKGLPDFDEPPPIALTDRHVVALETWIRAQRHTILTDQATGEIRIVCEDCLADECVCDLPF